jgi:uncharacterized repeat protein (TIGR03803 family)
MQYLSLPTFRTSELKKIPQAFVLGGLLVIGSSLLTLTPVMASGIQNLASFDGDNGAEPSASVTLGTDGLFYGTTQVGGSSGSGTIFSFNPSGNVLTSLASFDGNNGGLPQGSLTLAPDGLFYGTNVLGGSSTSGGSFGLGTIFSFNPSGNVLTSLVSFDGNNGHSPHGSLTLAPDGLFYGTTVFGGSSDLGTIFSFNPSGNVLTSLASFDGDNRALPIASLTLGTDGLFYGTTYVGGSPRNFGTIFSFNLSGNVLTSLASFDRDNRGLPQGSLTLAPDGLFYGTTPHGGNSYNGTIFSFNPSGNVLTSLVSFDGNNGDGPYASLTLAPDGLFYGNTYIGGSSDLGTIFSFNPSGTSVPEPSSLLGLLTLGTLGAAATFKRKLKREQSSDNHR